MGLQKHLHEVRSTSHQRSTLAAAWSMDGMGTRKPPLVSRLSCNTDSGQGLPSTLSPWMRNSANPTVSIFHLPGAQLQGPQTGQSESAPHQLLFLASQTLGILAFPYKVGRDTHRGLKWSQDPLDAFFIRSTWRNSINAGSFQTPFFPAFHILYTLQNIQLS